MYVLFALGIPKAHAAEISVETITGIHTVDTVIGSSIDASCTPPGVSFTAPCFYNNWFISSIDETITEAELESSLTYVNVVDPIAGMGSYVFSSGEAYIDVAFSGIDIYNGPGNDLVFFFLKDGYSFQLDLLNGNGAQTYSVTAADIVAKSGGGNYWVGGVGYLHAVFVDLDDLGLGLGDQLGTLRITTGDSLGYAVLSILGGFYTQPPAIPPPTVASISPNTVDARGGIVVTITGSNFVTGTTAEIAGTMLTGISVVNSTTITATIPPLPEGVHDLVITTPALESATLNNAFTVTPSPEFIAGDLAPRGATDGQLNAGDLVMLNRIVLDEITPTTKESLIGDVSPVGTPDGVINAADLLMLQKAIMDGTSLGNVLDDEGPQITISSPADNSFLNVTTTTINGSLDEEGDLVINGMAVPVDQFYAFAHNVNLQEGINNFSMQATDIYGNTQADSLTVNRDTVSPASVDGSRLTISSSGSLTTIFGAVGSVEAGATVSIFANGVTTNVVADTNGAFNTTINASQGDIIQITVLDAASNTSGVETYTAGTLQIISPSEGDTISSNTVNVVGIFADENNSGINVNGKVACTYNNNFYVNSVPLATGINTLTATYTTEGGSTQSTSIDITQSGVPDYEFSANQDCGVAPLNVNFSLNEGNKVIQLLEVDYDNNGTIDISTATPSVVTLQHNYTSPGVYQATIWVTSGGDTQQLTLNIVVQDPQIQDDIFQAIWNGMWTALLAGDKATALTYISPDSQPTYDSVFDALLPNMAAIKDRMTEIRRVNSSANIGSYAVLKNGSGQNKLYMINYIRGNNGVWRIDSM